MPADRLEPHQLGLPRPAEGVTHMCPECGNPPAPFCSLCLGAGVVTTDRLDRYAVAQERLT